MTREELRRKVAPVLVRRTLTQAAMMSKVRPEPRTQEEERRPTQPPAQQELPLNDNIVLGLD